MKCAFLALLAALMIVPPSAQGQTAPASKEAFSMHDQIKADRAKSKADFENSPKERPWDRDDKGERPWDRKETPRPKG